MACAILTCIKLVACMLMCVHACNCTHQVKKTEVENAAGVEGAVEENLSWMQCTACSNWHCIDI